MKQLKEKEFEEFQQYLYNKAHGYIWTPDTLELIVKPTKSAVAMMPNADMELPYDGAKEMLLVDDVDNKEFLRKLLEAMYEELPAPKKKK